MMILTSRGLLFSLYRTSSSFRLQWISLNHVVPVRRTSVRRCLNSKANGGGAEVYHTVLDDSKNLKARNYLMITSSLPSITKYQDVLDQLAKLLGKSGTSFGSRSLSSLIILATPTFASWLENSAFMGKVLHAIFGRDGATKKTNLAVNTLLAVIDGLPPASRISAGPKNASEEGFAIIFGEVELLTPGIWNQDKQEPRTQNERQRSNVVFSMPIKSNGEGVVEVTIPLANTMFRNGRTSTLLLSRWRRREESEDFEKLEQFERDSVTIFISPSASAVPLYRDIPLAPLTPPRQVASGLGNIIRQVLNVSGKAVSASQELEASVDGYLDARKLPKQTVTVWALIISESSMALCQTSHHHVEMDSKVIQDSWTAANDPWRYSYVGNWLDNQGVSLHRVLSGGGGWGPKQGLLSLDPETSLMESAQVRHEFDLSESTDIDQLRAFGNIAKPGSWVQFLISDRILSNGASNKLSLPVADPESLNVLTFGCIPSTIDNMPQPSSGLSASTYEDVRAVIQGFECRFGAQSEAGIFIRQNENGLASESKIDVPFSSFGWAVLDGATLPVTDGQK